MTKKKKIPTGHKRTLFFTAKWCPPCQVVKRMLAKQEALAQRLEIVDIDTDAGKDLADDFKVQAIPIFIRPDGEAHLGPLNKRELEAFLSGGGGVP